MKLNIKTLVIVFSMLCGSGVSANTNDGISIGDLARVVDSAIGAKFQVSELEQTLGRMHDLKSKQAKYLVTRINDLNKMIKESRDFFGLRLKLSEDIMPATIFPGELLVFENDHCKIEFRTSSYSDNGLIGRLKSKYFGIPFASFKAGYLADEGSFQYSGKFTPEDQPNLKMLTFESSEHDGPKGFVTVSCIGSDLDNTSNLSDFENALDNKITLKTR